MTPYSVGSMLSYKNTSAEHEDQDLVLHELRNEQQRPAHPSGHAAGSLI